MGSDQERKERETLERDARNNPGRQEAYDPAKDPNKPERNPGGNPEGNPNKEGDPNKPGGPYR